VRRSKRRRRRRRRKRRVSEQWLMIRQRSLLTFQLKGR
jgi:hypothetical protein